MFSYLIKIFKTLGMIMPKSRSPFDDYLTTLKETSKDEDNAEYMTESTYPAVNFDCFKSGYDSNKFCGFRSNDALLIPPDCNNKFVFIEFKNGGIERNITDTTEIVEKIYESLFVFNEVKKKNISFDKFHVVYVLVYNEEKNSLYALNSHSAKNARKKYIIPQLDRYKILFSDFFTMTKSEFCEVTTKLDAGVYPF